MLTKVSSVLLFSLVLAGTPAMAHRLNVFAWPESGTVATQSRFSGGSSARGALVSVRLASGGQTLLTGKTDEKGIFRFAPPREALAANSGVIVVVRAGEGHQNSWPVSIEDLRTATASPTPAASAAVHAESKSADTKPLAPAKAEEKISLTAGELEALVDRAMNKRLAPLEMKLAQALNPDPTWRDIAGGLGWFVGLGGIAAFLGSRKKKTSGEKA